MTTVRVTETELLRFAQEVFVAVGVPSEHAATVAENLVQGELHGMGSHGVSRLLEVYAERFAGGGVNPNPEIEIVQRDRGCALIDGDNGPGAVVGRAAMDLAIELAREHGSGWVGVRNSNHYGAAFLFARMAMAHDMIGFCTTNTVPQMAPLGGRDKLLGTNPLCVAVPGGERGPVILDMATTQTARGKVQVAAVEGREIPLGWGVDKDDRPTTDPAEVWRLLPVGGAKGYGLAIVLEILSAVLSGAMVGNQVGFMFDAPTTSQRLGHFMGAMDLSGFGDVGAFRQRMDGLIGYLKDSDREEGVLEILVPGEPESRAAEANRRQGIPFSEDIHDVMQRVAERFGVRPLEVS